MDKLGVFGRVFDSNRTHFLDDQAGDSLTQLQNDLFEGPPIEPMGCHHA